MGEMCALALLSVLFVFALAVLQRQYYYSKYLPPMMDGELFVEVQSPGGLSYEQGIGLCRAYLFEINATSAPAFPLFLDHMNSTSS